MKKKKQHMVTQDETVKNEVKDNPGNMSIRQQTVFEHMREVDKLRFDVLKRFFNNAALDLLPLIGINAENRWRNLFSKIGYNATRTQNQAKMYSALEQNITIGQIYQLPELVNAVQDAMVSVDFQAYGERIFKEVLRFVNRLFVVEEVYQKSDDGGKSFLGYRPVFCLRPTV